MATRRGTRRRRPSTSASRSGLRRPTATIPVRASATIPSGIEPTRSSRPAGVCDAGGERAGSAAGGEAPGAADPPPAAAEAGTARAARRRKMADTIAGSLATEGKTARPRAPTLVPAALALGAAATVAYGISRDLGGVLLGAPHPPFIAAWDPRTHPAGWAAVALLVAALVGAPRLLAARVSPARFALGAFAGTLVLRLALAALRDGPAAWTRVFDLTRSGEAKNEYLAGLPALRYGVGFFLDRFAELVPSLPVHVAGHPPGLMAVIGALGVDTPARLAALCIVAGAASAPLTYALARGLAPERTARVAAVLVAMAPGALQYGATSADALYLTLGLVAACGLASPGWPARGAGAVALAVASFFAWSLLAVGAWAILLLRLRAGPRRALEMAALCGLALGGLYARLAGAARLDTPRTVRATRRGYLPGGGPGRPSPIWGLRAPDTLRLTR